MPRTLAPLLLALASTVQAAEPFTAKVVAIADGDTLTVLRDGKTQVKIRLHDIDAPETGQPFGTKAKEAAAGLAFGKVVTIDPHGPLRRHPGDRHAA